MAIVYKHIRKDTNEIFYIGIGNDKSRAFSAKGRNNHWKHIVDKYGYIVDIIETDINWQTACEKEIELIKEYGRRDLGFGTLVNMTDGGDGKLGPQSAITKNKISKALLKNHIAKGKTFIELYGIEKAKIIKSKLQNNNSKYWKNKIRSEAHCKNLSVNHIDVSGAKNPRARTVLQYTKDNQFVKEWDYIKAAAEYINNHSSNIIKCCNGIAKSCGGYVWKYKIN
jgi:hypothetical protein